MFQKYGFLPELVGRFSRIVSFPALQAETLRQILRENIVPQFKNEFRGEGLELTVSNEALNYLVKRSEKRGTGARGLHTELIKAIEQAAFETFSRINNAEIIISCENEKLKTNVLKA